jgi:hypothetical protein
MPELLTQVNIIQTAVGELEKNLTPRERVLVKGAIDDITTAVGTMKQLICQSTADNEPG